MNEALRDEVYVGIDVCKDWLDVHLHPIGRRVREANSRDALRRLLRILADCPVALAVMEATAKYHRLAHRMLAAAGIAAAVVNPLRACLFAEASGQLAKTDRVDARLLALMGESLKPAAVHRSRRCWKPCRSWCAAVWQRSRKQQRWRTVWAPRQAPFSRAN